MAKCGVKGIKIELMIENNYISPKRTYFVTSYGALKRFGFVFGSESFMDYTYISVDAVRKILNEKHPYERFQIAEEVFNKHFDSDCEREIIITEDESGKLEKEFDFP